MVKFKGSVCGIQYSTISQTEVSDPQHNEIWKEHWTCMNFMAKPLFELSRKFIVAIPVRNP